jgi:hypothetical protein
MTLAGSAKGLIVVAFDSSCESLSALFSESLRGLVQEKPARSQLFKLDDVKTAPGKEAAQAPAYLALVSVQATYFEEPRS